MKKLVLALSLLASPSYAADTLTLTIVSDSATWSGTASKSWTFTQGDMTTFLAWLNASYPCVPVPPATSCVFTYPNALLAWANGFKAGTVSNVVNWQNQAAAAAAISGVTPINPN